MVKRLPDPFAWFLMWVAALIDRSAWNKYRFELRIGILPRRYHNEGTPFSVFEVLHRLQGHIVVRETRWDGWVPARYV